jgi:tRNA/tmRNA/rRNA uracil-C5-methylase (TrmA/RlmC/RlmD family)
VTQSAAATAPETSLVGERYEVEIGPVAHGGHCVARHDGRVIFVRHGLPGELAIVEITDGGADSKFLRGDVVEVLKASEDRVPVPCEYAGPGLCGGCDWQHATPEAQRRLKAAVVQEQLLRLAKTEMDIEVEALPTEPGAVEGTGWRTRMQFAIEPVSGKAGLRKHRSHEVQVVDKCLIAYEGVEELGIESRSWDGVAEIDAIASAGSSDRAVVITPAGMTRRSKRGPSEDPAEAKAKAEAVAIAAATGRMPIVELDEPASVFRTDANGGVQKVHGRPAVRETAAGRTWRVSNNGFWQVHPAAADTLVKAVLKALQPQPGDTALDLYCGVGLFAGAIADRLTDGGRVHGVEANKQAIEDAVHNLRDVDNARFEVNRVDRALGRNGFLVAADIVVLDPPRAGAGKQVVEGIAKLAPRRIAYVACDPSSLARDVAYFAKSGNKLREVRAFDLFPNTQHVECVALLVPSNPEATAKRNTLNKTKAQEAKDAKAKAKKASKPVKGQRGPNQPPSYAAIRATHR